MFVFILVFFTAVLYYLYFRRQRKSLYELSESLPNVGNLPLIGHTHWFIGGPEKLLSNIKNLGELVDQSKEGIASVWIGPKLYVVSMNPDEIQMILDNCLNKDYTYKFLRNWLGNGLFVAPVNLWKQHRRLLVPIFHNKLVEDYIDVFGQQAAILEKKLEEKCGKGEFEAFSFVTSCMLDIVFETAMGERMDVQNNPDTPYLNARNTVMSIINMRLFKAWLQPDALFNLTSYSKMQKDSIEMTHKFTDEVVNKKRMLYENNNSPNGRKDMLEILLERNNKFTNTELRDHIDSITIAGNDTTALVIAYTLLLLGCHQEEQEKVYQELEQIFGDSKRLPTKEDMNKMECMERVIKESMRLYTVVPIIGRETDKEIKLSSSYTIPAGVGCAVLSFVLHRSKRHWGDDADQFNPDRFLPENSVNRHPCAYIPFSHGIRNCIGRHFGMLAMKSILATLLRTYKVRSEAIDRLKIEILLFPVKGHLISVEKRRRD